MRRTELAPISKKQRKFEAAWQKVRLEVIATTDVCPGLRAWPDVACGGRVEVHHLKPRSVDKKGRLDVENLVAICSTHHQLISDNPAYAHKFGLHKFSYERDDDGRTE